MGNYLKLASFRVASCVGVIGGLLSAFVEQLLDNSQDEEYDIIEQVTAWEFKGAIAFSGLVPTLFAKQRSMSGGFAEGTFPKESKYSSVKSFHNA